jgi:hypothetical protein
VGVRKIVLWSSNLAEARGFEFGHEWQEGIVVYSPHTRPEDSVEIDAVHVANMKGETGKWSWARHGNPTTLTPEGSNIVLMNVKSETKPFVISPEGCQLSPYEGSQGGSHFRWRDHWPTTMEPVTGRDASGEQAAHGSFFHIRNIPIYEQAKQRVSKILLHGMTQSGVADLVPLAKSWMNAPELKLYGNSKFSNQGYDKSQRAYVLSSNSSDGPSRIKFKLKASEDQPIVNSAFVVKNWGEDGVSLKINGAEIKRGKAFRFGHRHRLEGIDLVVWIKIEATRPVEIQLSPVIE